MRKQKHVKLVRHGQKENLFDKHMLVLCFGGQRAARPSRVSRATESHVEDLMTTPAWYPVGEKWILHERS